tara:strand:+ start:2936 stop:4270 length:1335 start_codon:yes stop_codon:yes gene_type:complete
MSKIDHDYYEKIIVYKLLTDETYLASTVDHIKSSYFDDVNISSIINIITDFYHTRSQIPTTSEIKSYLVTDKLKREFKTVVGYLKDVADPGLNSDELYENTEIFLREKAVMKTLLAVSEQYAKEKEHIDTSKVLDQFDQACGITLSVDMGFDLLNNIDQHIEDLEKRDKTIPTTWPWLDEKLDGGLLEDGRALYIFAGETNIGKSIILGNLALNIAGQNKSVLLVSLEMSEKIYTKRLTSSLSSIPISELAANSTELRNQLVSYKNNHDKSRLLIKEFPPNTITANHLKGFIKKIVASGIKLDCIVLDYVNLLHSSTGNNSYERVKHATEKLRALSYEFECPIVTATQLNRSGYSEANPTLDTVSESIGLAATADAIFSLWQEEEDAELGVMRMGLMKNRFGPNFGSTIMRVDYNTLTVAEDPDAVIDDISNDEAEDMLGLLSG